MTPTITYDDSKLRQLFAELQPAQRVKALRGAFRKAAGKVRKAAVANLKKATTPSTGAPIHNAAAMAKGVRAIVFKRKAGFRVTIGSKKANKNGKGERGMHVNRRGQKKPVLIWAELGTDMRATRGRRRSLFGRRAGGRPTGSMPSYGFMAKTKAQVRDSVTGDIHDAVRESVIKTARKYGCK